MVVDPQDALVVSGELEYPVDRVREGQGVLAQVVDTQFRAHLNRLGFEGDFGRAVVLDEPMVNIDTPWDLELANWIVRRNGRYGKN